MDFIYQYGDTTRYAEIFFGDGNDWWSFAPSNLLGDALQAMLDGVARALTYEPLTQIHWFDEPGEVQWLLQRDGDELHITVIEYDDHLDRREGNVLFETTVDLWTFVQRVRLAASRVAQTSIGPQGKHVSFENDPAYRTLVRILNEHRRS